MFRFPFTANRWQVLTYLLGVALFSIAFLVFVTSSVSWVITDLLGRRSGVGDAVGTLGFADELVALVACPAWGIISDRIGVRAVAVFGYTIVGLSLFLFVQAKNVYPELLLARLFFSLGGAATSTMVTAILPTMTLANSNHQCGSTHRVGPFGSNHIVAPSISSELTITPARYRSQSPTSQPQPAGARKVSTASNSQLAGLVGMFTGLGALIALGLFLPLPTRFQKSGASRGESVAKSYYVVGTVAFLVAVICLFGLRNLPGEDGKGVRAVFGMTKKRTSGDSEPINPNTRDSRIPYHKLLLSALALGVQDIDIGLGYLGGFVARASSVGISTFIPLATNAYFISVGACDDEPTDLDSSDLSDIRDSCRRAYILAATLTGTSQLVALICAPVFGFFSGRYPRFNIPLLTAAIAGMIGYIAFAFLPSPDPRNETGSGAVYLFVALMGVSQIGAIVCSLGLLARGIQKQNSYEHHFRDVSFSGSANPNIAREINDQPHEGPDVNPDSSSRSQTTEPPLRDPLAEFTPAPTVSNDGSYDESTPLIHGNRSPNSPPPPSRSILKGSISGIYSFSGGAGILLLTKLGGALFDESGHEAPFVMMAVFNAILFVVAITCAIWDAIKGTREKATLVKGGERLSNGEARSGSRDRTVGEVC